MVSGAINTANTGADPVAISGLCQTIPEGFDKRGILLRKRVGLGEGIDCAPEFLLDMGFGESQLV